MRRESTAILRLSKVERCNAPTLDFMDAFRHHGAMEGLGDRLEQTFPVTGKSDLLCDLTDANFDPAILR